MEAAEIWVIFSSFFEEIGAIAYNTAPMPFYPRELCLYVVMMLRRSNRCQMSSVQTHRLSNAASYAELAHVYACTRIFVRRGG